MAKGAMRFFPIFLAALLVGLSSAAPAADLPFADWLAAFKAEAVAGGIDQSVADQALADIQPIDRVIELDRKQPEFTMTWDEYLAHTASPQRIADGRKQLAANRKELHKIGAEHGVPAQQLVAMWGIESNFGSNMGSFGVIPALATLAYDGRRSAYFRGELMKAMTMAQRGVPPQNMRGSWAGAMGQCQFMPSTYLNYAQSASGEGPADIWGKKEDVWASTANYLQGLGWNPGEPWGFAIRLPKRGLAPALFGLDHPRPLKDWSRLGVLRADGKKLNGPPEMKLALLHADASKDGSGGTAQIFLVGDNFRAILHWNRSFFFALAAGTLADRVASR
jgi:membrane-bound lytic murein transglycosylase B